jgi:zinc transport system permease protein
MALSVAAGMLLTVAGLWLSYVFNLASGATIVIVLAVAFVIASLLND